MAHLQQAADAQRTLQQGMKMKKSSKKKKQGCKRGVRQRDWDKKSGGKKINLNNSKQFDIMTVACVFVCVCWCAPFIDNIMMTNHVSPPSEQEFVDIFQKIKYSFSLLVTSSLIPISLQKVVIIIMIHIFHIHASYSRTV